MPSLSQSHLKGFTSPKSWFFAIFEPYPYIHMRAWIYLTTLLTILSHDVLAQKAKSSLFRKFTTADSVVAISHSGTGMPIYDPKTKEEIGFVRVVDSNLPNHKIITASIKLNKKEIDLVAKILLAPNHDKEIKDNKCFIPHNGILLFKGDKCAYFDICLDCRHFITSNDILLSDELSKDSWNKLERFFKRRNLYQPLTFPTDNK